MIQKIRRIKTYVLTNIPPKNIFYLFLCVFASNQQLVITIHRATENFKQKQKNHNTISHNTPSFLVILLSSLLHIVQLTVKKQIIFKKIKLNIPIYFLLKLSKT